MNQLEYLDTDDINQIELKQKQERDQKNKIKKDDLLFNNQQNEDSIMTEVSDYTSENHSSNHSISSDEIHHRLNIKSILQKELKSKMSNIL